MKISIVTATYNRADTIRDTIESILSQTYQDWEHIIIDGASKDNTLQVIKEYETRYNGRLKLVSEPDKGIYDAMNKGIRMATGDIVGILNSDDFYTDSLSMNHIVEGFKNINQTDAIHAGIINVDGDNTQKVIFINKGKPKPQRGFYTGWYPIHPTFYVRREIYKRFGLFDLNFGTASDFELMIRFIEKEKIRTVHIPHFIVTQRMGGASNNSLKAILQANKYVLKAFDKNGLDKPSFYFIKKQWPKFIKVLKQKFKSL